MGCEGCKERCSLLSVRGVTEAGRSCCHASIAGCGIYPDRPKQCADYACIWLLGRLFPSVALAIPRELRPDIAGVVFDLGTMQGGAVLWIRESRRDGFEALAPHAEAVILVIDRAMRHGMAVAVVPFEQRGDGAPVNAYGRKGRADLLEAIGVAETK